MALHRGTGGSEPLRAEPVARLADAYEQRWAVRVQVLGTGTLACPRCDAPVALAGAPRGPGDPLACPFCAHAGAVRAFLSLSAPSRPARVAVRVVERPSRALR